MNRLRSSSLSNRNGKSIDSSGFDKRRCESAKDPCNIFEGFWYAFDYLQQLPLMIRLIINWFNEWQWDEQIENSNEAFCLRACWISLSRKKKCIDAAMTLMSIKNAWGLLPHRAWWSIHKRPSASESMMIRDLDRDKKMKPSASWAWWSFGDLLSPRWAVRSFWSQFSNDRRYSWELMTSLKECHQH